MMIQQQQAAPQVLVPAPQVMIPTFQPQQPPAQSQQQLQLQHQMQPNVGQDISMIYDLANRNIEARYPGQNLTENRMSRIDMEVQIYSQRHFMSEMNATMLSTLQEGISQISGQVRNDIKDVKDTMETQLSIQRNERHAEQESQKNELTEMMNKGLEKNRQEFTSLFNTLNLNANKAMNETNSKITQLETSLSTKIDDDRASIKSAASLNSLGSSASAAENHPDGSPVKEYFLYHINCAMNCSVCPSGGPSLSSREEGSSVGWKT